MSDEKKETLVDEKLDNAKKAEGIKFEAKSDEVFLPVKESENSNVCFPSFFIEENSRHKITLDVLFDKKNGKIVSITKAGLGLDLKQFYSSFGHFSTWFEFTQPNYEDISFYRQRSSVFNVQARQMIIDSVLLRKHYLIWHLKDWSLCDNNGKKIDLTFEAENGGPLSDDCQKIVFSTSPSLVDVALTNFEKDIILV